MTESIFKKYLESLVEAKEDVVTPEIKNTFAGEVVEEEVKLGTVYPSHVEKVDTREKVNADIDALLKKMLPQFGAVEDKVLEKHEKEIPDLRSVTSAEELNRPSILDTLRKQPTDKLPEVKGLEGVEYEEYDPSNIHFMKELPRHELKQKDHSGIIIAKQCLRKYFLSSVVNLVPAEDTNIFYPWGTAYHIFRQRLSEHYGYGVNEPSPYNSEKAKEAFRKAAKEGTEYWMMNGEDQPVDSRYDWYTTERLYKSFVKAFEHWVAERKKGQVKVIAVEQYFSVMLPDGRFKQGRIDEAIIYNNELWGRDFKTTMKPEEWFAKSLRPNNQVRTYTYGNGKLAGRPARGIFIQAMYNAKSTKKEDKGPLVYEKIIECSPYELTQWEKEQVFWNEILDKCREQDIWPESEVNCQYCEYQFVCMKSTEASMVHALENKYRVRLRDPARVDLVVD